MFTLFIYPILVSIIISFYFFSLQRKDTSTGKKYLKEIDIGIYLKEEVYGYFTTKYKYYVIPHNNPLIIKAPISEEEYSEIIGEEKKSEK